MNSIEIRQAIEKRIQKIQPRLKSPKRTRATECRKAAVSVNVRNKDMRPVLSPTKGRFDYEKDLYNRNVCGSRAMRVLNQQTKMKGRYEDDMEKNRRLQRWGQLVKESTNSNGVDELKKLEEYEGIDNENNPTPKYTNPDYEHVQSRYQLPPPEKETVIAERIFPFKPQINKFEGVETRYDKPRKIYEPEKPLSPRRTRPRASTEAFQRLTSPSRRQRVLEKERKLKSRPLSPKRIARKLSPTSSPIRIPRSSISSRSPRNKKSQLNTKVKKSPKIKKLKSPRKITKSPRIKVGITRKNIPMVNQSQKELHLMERSTVDMPPPTEFQSIEEVFYDDHLPIPSKEGEFVEL